MRQTNRQQYKIMTLRQEIDKQKKKRTDRGKKERQHNNNTLICEDDTKNCYS